MNNLSGGKYDLPLTICRASTNSMSILINPTLVAIAISDSNDWKLKGEMEEENQDRG